MSLYTAAWQTCTPLSVLQARPFLDPCHDARRQCLQTAQIIHAAITPDIDDRNVATSIREAKRLIGVFLWAGVPDVGSALSEPHRLTTFILDSALRLTANHSTIA